MQNNIKNSSLSNSSDGKYVSLDELNNMNFLSGKQFSNGASEFNTTKQWTKNTNDMETEQINNQQILSEIKKIEENIDAIIKLFENVESNPINIKKDIAKNSQAINDSNSTWKDKFKNIVK